MKTELDLTPLDNYSFKGVTASIILDTRKEKKNEVYPVKYRVRFDGAQDFYKCKDLSKEQYSRLHKATRDADLTKDKKQIADGFKQITDLIEEIEPFTLTELARRIKGGAKDSIDTAFENKAALLKREGRIGSYFWYSSALTSIKKYDKRDLKFSDITPEWLKGYHKKLEKEKKKDTTISINMRALKAIINEGMRKGVITQSQYPFGESDDKYQIPTGEGQKIALSISQLKDVFNYPLLPDEEKYRDLFIFSFFCNGCNIGDILRFKHEDIKHTTQSNIIEWHRHKTIKKGMKKRRLQAVITEQMQSIIDRNSNPFHKPDDYLFPYLSAGLSPIREREIIQEVTHVVNHKLKKISDALGIEKLTSYSARHSFASISRRSGVEIFEISKSLGHGDIKTTEIYLDSLSVDELINNAAKVQKALEYESKEKLIVNKPA